ncbi:THO complex subunit 4A-like isoform X1 [Nicotiana tomentosiformis]|uniref:THO complex subunit 4A-like isoform X1 n=1 Tax=Nicotiana tomentosiformis TaxID=4098 RepID=UPI00051C6AEE|nr:THO complex subunit 4A-like isoform X1 [Nicotiana tomentosiformis]
MSNLDVSLDDLIKRNKSSSSRNPRPRTSGSGSGSGSRGPGPRRRFPNRTANRPAPYSSGPVHAPESTWDHDMFAEHAPAYPAARGAGGISGIETGIKLLISNLDYGVSNEDIKELFSEAGDIKRYSIHYDKSGRSKGTAEVIFARRRDAEAAIKKYNNVQLDGKPMKIEFAGPNIGAPALPPIRNRLYRNPNPAPRSQQRGGGFRRPPRGGRGSMRKEGGRGRGRGENISAEDLDADLEKYHSEAMETN